MTHITLLFEDGNVMGDVPVPRVPVVGERLLGPDDFGEFEVVSVTFEYAKGFYYEPTNVNVEVRRVP